MIMHKQMHEYKVTATVSSSYIIEADSPEDAENEARGYLLESIRKGEVHYDDIEVTTKE